MFSVISKTPADLGREAAAFTANCINKAIAEKGRARIVMSTGASQFTLIESLLDCDVDWSKVDMFHLDEYIGLPDTHPASFVRYLKERFVSKVNLGSAHFVEPARGVDAVIASLTDELNESPVDVGLIGIGENAHIAFNDPPADFQDPAAYKVVTLDETCRRQQLGEGWFPDLDSVPKQAISMTVSQILKCKTIVSAVPYAVKARAIQATLEQEVTPMVPATILKTHPDWHLFLDRDSASLLTSASV